MIWKFVIGLLLHLSIVLALSIPPQDNADLVSRSDPSPGPFTTSSRWILDANGKRFKMRCVHWVAHMEVGIPEGLQHQSIDHITSWIAKNNFNCVRLSYSIDFALNPNQLVSDSFNAAAGLTGVSPADMTTLYNSVVKNNPRINAKTTVLNVHEAVLDSLNGANIKVILDNHVSKASWCCSNNDGNGWFNTADGGWFGLNFFSVNTKYFDIDKWLQGLTAMANFSKGRPNIIGMDLRNEMRPVVHDTGNWYKFIPQGASAIHTANPDLLIIIGGLSYAVDLSFVYSSPLDTSAWPNKTVYEFHAYTWSHSESFNQALTPAAAHSDSQCQALQSDLGHSAGFILKQNEAYTGPLWLSEFGVGVAGPSTSDHGWLSCMVDYMTSNDAEWDLWTLGGDYYVRDGKVNYDESFGLLDPSWADWRNPGFPALLGGMWDMTQGP